MMTGNAINANSDELSSEQLDAVSGGWLAHWISFPTAFNNRAELGVGQCYGGGGGMQDPAQMFGQIMQQMTGG
jgi:hypothetical protein